MSLSPKASGVIGVVLGAGCLAYTWHTLQTEGKYYPVLLMLGLAVLPISLASVVLPLRLLYVPTEIDGRLEYDTRKPKFTTLGGALMALGLLAGVGVYIYLKV